jgi:hypothetical protein
VLLLRAGELNVREVPEVTEPVLVTESEGLADREAKAVSSEGTKIMKCWESVPGIPRLQPLMKEPAMARTSLGRKAMSNDWEMAVALSKRFSMVPWRASTVTMVAAAVRTRGSWTRCAAPRYAATPTCSTTRAIVTMVDTSVRADEKSNEQPEGGVAPNEVMMDWGPRIVKR